MNNLDELLDNLKTNCYPLGIECAHRLEIEGDSRSRDLFGRLVQPGEYFKVDISIMVSTEEHDEIKT